MKKKFIIISKPSVPNGFMCVYKIKFGNRLFYIGSTKCLNKRISGHISTIKMDYINSQEQSLRLTSRDCVTIEILETVNDPLVLQEREDFYIQIHFNRNGFLNKRTAVTKKIIKSIIPSVLN